MYDPLSKQYVGSWLDAQSHEFMETYPSLQDLGDRTNFTSFGSNSDPM